MRGNSQQTAVCKLCLAFTNFVHGGRYGATLVLHNALLCHTPPPAGLEPTYKAIISGLAGCFTGKKWAFSSHLIPPRAIGSPVVKYARCAPLHHPHGGYFTPPQAVIRTLAFWHVLQ